jgi:hypothetical protein
MLNKYEVIGRERVVYKGVVLANSSDEAEEKFRGYLKWILLLQEVMRCSCPVSSWK